VDIIAKLVNDKILEAKKIALEKSKNKEQKETTKVVEKTTENVEKTLNQEEIEKQNLIKALDDRFYYDKNFNVYSLNLSYIK